MTGSSVRAAPGLLSSAPLFCQPPFLTAHPTHLELSPRTWALDAVGRWESGVAVQSPWVSTEQELGIKADLEGVLQGAILAPFLLPPRPPGHCWKSRAGLHQQGPWKPVERSEEGDATTTPGQACKPSSESGWRTFTGY